MADKAIGNGSPIKASNKEISNKKMGKTDKTIKPQVPDLILDPTTKSNPTISNQPGIKEEAKPVKPKLPNMIWDPTPTSNEAIRPNFKKMFTVNVVKVVLSILVLILALMIFIAVDGFESLRMTLSGLGITVDPRPVVLWPVSLIIFGYIILLVLNYTLLRNIRYELFPDKILCYETMFFILVDIKEVFYKNITRIAIDTSGIINLALNTGNLILEVSAMKEKSFKIECVDDPSKVAQRLQEKINKSKTKFYAGKIKDYNLNEIMDRGGI